MFSNKGTTEQRPEVRRGRYLTQMQKCPSQMENHVQRHFDIRRYFDKEFWEVRPLAGMVIYPKIYLNVKSDDSNH